MAQPRLIASTAAELSEPKLIAETFTTEAGRKAALEANVHGVNKKMIDQLGRLHLRTSYGQNVLRHSIEVAYLCGMMADELGLDGALARRCGLADVV